MKITKLNKTQFLNRLRKVYIVDYETSLRRYFFNKKDCLNSIKFTGAFDFREEETEDETRVRLLWSIRSLKGAKINLGFTNFNENPPFWYPYRRCWGHSDHNSFYNKAVNDIKHLSEFIIEFTAFETYYKGYLNK